MINYEAHREAMVGHFVFMLQADSDYARHAIREYVARKGCPFPDIAMDVKRRLEDLAITPEPRSPEPWFLAAPNQQGWRQVPAVQ